MLSIKIAVQLIRPLKLQNKTPPKLYVLMMTLVILLVNAFSLLVLEKQFDHHFSPSQNAHKLIFFANS